MVLVSLIGLRFRGLGFRGLGTLGLRVLVSLHCLRLRRESSVLENMGLRMPRL